MPEDEFNLPTYSADYGRAPRGGGSGGLVKMVLLVGVVAIAALAVYFLVFAGNVEATVWVQDAAGQPLAFDYATIYDESGERIARFSQNPFEGTLKAGAYVLSVEAQDLAGNTRPFEISASENQAFVRFSKRIDVEIAGVTTDFSGTLFAGEDAEWLVQLQNTGKRNDTVELYVEAPEGVEADVYPETVVTTAGQSAAATLTVRVPATYRPKDAQSGDALVIKVGIAGAPKSAAEEVGLVVLPQPSFKFTTTTLHMGTVSADGAPVQKQISLKNTAKFDITTPVSFEVEINQSANDPAEVAKWFSFTPDVPSLDAGETARVFLEAVVPVGASADSITGTVVAKNANAQARLNFTMEVEEPDYQLKDKDLTGVSETQSLLRDDAGYKEKALFLTVNNRTDFDLTDVAVSSNCDSTWVFVDEPAVGDIVAGDQRDVAVKISAPASTPGNESQPCKLVVTYDNPIVEGDRLSAQTQFFIKTPAE